MTITAPAPITAGSVGTVPATRLSFPRIVRSEAIKLLSLRSTWWSLAIAATLSVGISLLMAAASSDFSADFPAVMAIVTPMQFTMLVAGILGAIAVTGEYSTGMIRSTLTAVPRRGAVLAAKTLTVAATLAIATTATFAVAILATAPLVSAPIDWADPAVSTIPLAYGVLSMAVFALIGVGFGFIIRSGAGAIAATVGVLFVAPIVTSIFAMFGASWQWVADLGRYLPMSAAQVLTIPGGTDDALRCVATLLAWVVAGQLGAWALLRSRDA
ncbi:MAG: ABC transporter permease subunit [Microbacterium sp.]